MSASDLERLTINTIRTLAMDAVQAAKSGHPGTPMAMAPVVYCLWQEFLRFDPDDPIWPNRDRFVLSMGHASMLLNSMRSEEHTSELQSRLHLVCRLLLEKKKVVAAIKHSPK